MTKIENFGSFEISSSKIFRKCIVQVEKFILWNLLYKTGHPIVKVPQFLLNLCETWSKLAPHEVMILTKFHDNQKKLELLLFANF